MATWQMKILNKSNVLTSVESMNQTLKKRKVEKIILKKGWENNFKNVYKMCPVQ